MEGKYGGFHMNTLNPTCTGTSVIAVVYDEGVAVMSDTVVSYGKSARYKNVTRQYKVNDRVIVAFSGDHADFHTLQNIIERQVAKWAVVGQKLNPSALFYFLTSLMYSSRCRMNPFWNTLIVAGWEENEEGGKPFLGHITQKGVAFEAKHTATGIASHLLTQVIEDETRDKTTLNRAKAESILRRAVELSIYHDCLADNEFEIGVVGKTEKASVQPQKPIIGDWSIAETNCQYE
ncbi:hypothetical protein PMAYCL1PPCAC_23528 [Pristionchus mayeri]|uniref:Proteasome subunit beta n=1 Tax=Pristionchus mayeri TaxID=1317129 RepID=A0AAN5CYV4_9BILA|nr:hypothetical protein PMAYCL1PPCAC_23528 [Pristionchus mayeri]